MPNSKTNEDEVIDLTSSFYYPSTPRNIVNTNIVIDLVNDSFDSETNYFTDHIRINTKKSKDHEGCSKDKDKEKTKAKKVGVCSICWDELGKKPLASTKCGHVYCLTCLENSLKRNKHCPICRCLLKGTTAYHPLYLELH